MKIFLLSIISLLTMAASAQKQYVKEWKRIDSLIDKASLPKSALKEVNNIYNAAKKENNDVQVIKALIYKMQLNDQVSEQGRYENIAMLEKEILTAKEPARSILHSIAGESYWTYLQMNRWQFYNRTNTKGYDNNDIATWTIEQLYERITNHYDQSLSNKKMLQQTTLAKYDPIIIKGNARDLRPTLYDLLAFRAIDYYRNDERYLTRPAFVFKINNPEAFADATEFAKQPFANADSQSLHYRAINTYQDLLTFHENDKNPSALIDADLNRLQFVKNFSVVPKKDQLYGSALERLANKYANKVSAAEIYLLLAQWHNEKAAGYQPFGDTTSRFEYVEAMKIIDKGLALNPPGGIAISLRNLKKTIIHESLSTEAEQVNTVGDPFRILVHYRNAEKSYIRVINLNQAVWDKLEDNRWSDDFWNRLSTLPAIKDYSEALPATNDYQQHSVELKIDGLPVGEYGILISATADFKPGKHALALQRLHVSDIAYISNGPTYYAVNRKSGVPLQQATVKVWQEYYNSTTRKSELKLLEKITADNNGAFQIKNNASNNVRLEITHGKDRLFLDNNVYAYAYDDVQQSKDSIAEETFLFTDRPLYRPGQVVFFKGILVKKNLSLGTSSIIGSRKIDIELIDANNQVIDSVSLTTNDFGSVSGKFTLPVGVLNGSFAIREKQSERAYNFQVEEYKRPKFFVTVNPPAGAYRLNDSISVTGAATSYAGNSLNGARVSYRVVRRANIPMWVRGYSRIWPPYPQEEMEITNGTAVTDADGKFIVRFKAIADPEIDKIAQPVFNYSVMVDVTDINGETRSAATSVSVAYQSIKLTVDLPEAMHIDSLRKLPLYTTNMNDSFERSKVRVEMYRLDAPTKVFRERFWDQPDQFVMSREEYYKNFPYDLYADENVKERWKKKEKVFEISGYTKVDSQFTIDKKIAAAGWYVVESSAIDRYGDTVTDRRFIRLYNDKPVTPEMAAILVADKKELQPGESTRYALQTNVDSAYVITEIAHGRKEPTIVLGKEGISGTITAQPSDKSGVVVKMALVRNNRFLTSVLHVPVVDKTKSLAIEYVSFRDKSQPGSAEKWKVKIKGSKGEKAAAELLTSMYDASLDQFYKNEWMFNPFAEEYPNVQPWNADGNFEQVHSIEKYFDDFEINGAAKIYDLLLSMQNSGIAGRLSGRVPGVKISAKAPIAQDAAMQESFAVENKNQSLSDSTTTKKQSPPIPTRKNLNETAFFFPDLRTDAEGNVEFTFTVPEALTTWKWRLLAHTRDLANVYGEKSFITQKQLMVQPNAPRFVREGDKIRFVAKIANITTNAISGIATLQLFDAVTGNEIPVLITSSKQVTFDAPANQSVPVSFNISIPKTFTTAITWRVIARSNSNDVSLSDGEENILPVLSNRMLVTETLPLHLRGEQKKSFSFDKLLNSGSSKTISNHLLTVEFTSNPAWYAVQALPWLAEEKNENAEQIFNRLYANTIASKIANSTPKLKAVIEKWKLTDTTAFMSALQKNEELKSALLEETPWVLEAKTEAQQKKNIALLFDVNRTAAGISGAVSKLQSMQNASGAFVWFPGGPDDRYMTQYIVTGFGRLKQLGALSTSISEKTSEMINRAITYLDAQIKRDYDNITKNNKKIATTYIAYEPVQYLYMRSFYQNVPVPAGSKAAVAYFYKQVKKDWVKQSTFMRAMIALVANRSGDAVTAKKIMAALKESAIINEETGMYWKDMNGGYYWYKAPIETQALLIEAFSEISNDGKAVGDLKTWLLKNKQTNSWSTSKATADACYALLLRGADWLNNEQSVTITAGNKTFSSSSGAETGTGYFKATVPGSAITPAMGNVTVNIPNASVKEPAWGAMYWQYFEELDKITRATTSLNINKKLFVQTNTDRGPVIQPLDGKNPLHVGDRVKVRIEIRADRSMEYVHLKDMRSSAMEPVNVVSQYKWQGGLGYYESTKDASTNFFFNYLPKGVHVFEYDLFITHEGTFSNGIATIQCMYAPEFSSNSEGITVNVKE